MSIKRYKDACEKTSANTKRPANNKFDFGCYVNSLHETMEKPKRYSMECGDDVHCMTVMPNREIHFHNHKSIQEMVHLVTFDILQNPDVKCSTLPTCLKILRKLRTKQLGNYKNRYGRSDVDLYSTNLLENNLEVIEARVASKTIHNPVPWRQEVLDTFKKNIIDTLVEELDYYGMGEKGNYSFNMNFEFCLSPSFMPSASMALARDREGWGYSGKTLTLFIKVSPQWLIKVWKRDKAVINKCLVLNIVKEYPNGTSLCMVAKQSHGFKIIPRLAVVDFNKQVLSWVIDPNRKDDLLEGDKTPRMRRTKKEIIETAGEAIRNELQNNPVQIPE